MIVFKVQRDHPSINPDKVSNLVRNKNLKEEARLYKRRLTLNALHYEYLDILLIIQSILESN